MTDVKTMCDEHRGGWEVVHTSTAGGLHILTIAMVSVDSCEYDEDLHHKLHEGLASHTHRKVVKTDCFTFDSYPTDEEIEAALSDYGFSPFIVESPEFIVFPFTGNIGYDSENGTKQIVSPIKTKTAGEEDTLEYSAILHPEEYNTLYSMLPIAIDEKPTSMSLKGDWLYLYYVRNGSVPPAQFFDRNFFLYSVRIHKDSGEILRKGYNKGLTLTDEELAGLEGASELANVIATGYYLDESMTTIYSMKSAEPEHYVNNPALVEVPYLGTTWKDGIALRTREYSR